MTVSNWPFILYTNKLLIAIQSDVQSPGGTECQTATVSEDENHNLRWIQLTLNGVTLYPQVQRLVFVPLIAFEVRYFRGSRRH